METAGEGEGVSAGLRGLGSGCSLLLRWDGELGMLGWNEAAHHGHWFCPAGKS